MNQLLPIVFLARHGETAWTLSGQYTGVTDLPLTERGERNARRLEQRLGELTFAKVFTSLEPAAGRFFLLSTASVSALSYEHNLSEPAIRLWDDDRHVGD